MLGYSLHGTEHVNRQSSNIRPLGLRQADISQTDHLSSIWISAQIEAGCWMLMFFMIKHRVLDTIKQSLVLDIELFKIRWNTSKRLLSTQILWSAERKLIIEDWAPRPPAAQQEQLTTVVSWGTHSLSSLSCLGPEWSPRCCTLDWTPLKHHARFSSLYSDCNDHHPSEWNKVSNKRLYADAKCYLRLVTAKLNKFQRGFSAKKIYFS